MKAPFYTQSGEMTKETLLPKEAFGQEVSPELLHQVMVAQQANRRIVIASTKDRSEVSGGGRKPWRQKGTGRARHGSIRSPLWVGGGVVFGPNSERNYKQKVNQKMARRALIGALSEKAKNSQVLVVDDLKLKSVKTKEAAGLIDKLPWRSSALLVMAQDDRDLFRAARNISGLTVTRVDQLTALNILSVRYLILTKGALAEIKTKFAS